MWKTLVANLVRFNSVKRVLLLSTLAFLAIAVVVNSVVIVERQEALGRVSRYNLTWLLSQAAHEVLRLEEVVSASALPGSRIDADAVALRLDVLANRLVLLSTGEAAEFIGDRPDLKRSVEELEATLATVEKLIGKLPDPQIALHVRSLLDPLVPKMLQMAAAANVRSGDVVAQDQQDLSFQHWLLTALLVTAAVLIVALLYRFASAQQSSKADLEVEISERTAQLRESLNYQTAISDVLKVMSRSTFDVDPVLQVVLDTATRLCRAQMAGLYQLEDGAFRWIAGAGSGALRQDFHLAEPSEPVWRKLVGRVALDGRAVCAADAAAESEYGGVVDPAGLTIIHSMLGIPMTRDGKLLGVLALARDQVEEFSEKQVEVAKVFADQAAIAIENVRLISEIRDKSRELEKALQHKSHFLATMSHELRTPMNGILGMIDVLEAEGPGKDQTHALTMMRGSAQLLLRNINDLLDYSKIEAGALRLEELPFRLKDLVDGAVDVFQPQAARKGLSLVGVVAVGSTDAFLGDPMRVHQIIFNLLSNALKFTDRGGIMLRAAADSVDGGSARVVFSVTDTGIGIDAEQQPLLFKPFSQVDSSITRRFGGSGLGLSIVKQLAELMSGDVTMTSLPGAGTTFTVTLRLKPAPGDARQAVPADAPTAARPAAGDLSSVGASACVLVVDDNPINCEVLLRQLKVLGVTAKPAYNGRLGLGAWRDGSFDIVFADIHMPLMDGFTMTTEIRSLEEHEGRARTPIVAVTADGLAGCEERCRAVGMDDFLAKPVDLDSLRNVLKRWLPADRTQAIDPTVLDTWTDSDDVERRDILRKFNDTVSTSSQDIEKALASDDLAALQSVAHRLRSGALAVGARMLGDSAGALEQAARTGDRPGCEIQLGHLVVEMDRVRAQIAA